MVSSGSRLLTVACILVSVSGCGMFSTATFPNLNDMFGAESGVRDEEIHRQRYQRDRDPDDLHWLLANRIESGMTVSEVGRTIGEEGRQVYDDGWIKRGGGYYQSGDKAWKWDPDRNGQSLILVFREGRLVNFDPTQYDQSDAFHGL